MTSTITISPAAPTSTLERVVEVVRSIGNTPAGRSRVAPAFIPADEAYYWSFHWQQDVQASMRALSEGEYVDFDSDDPNDVARWLLSVDDDC